MQSLRHRIKKMKTKSLPAPLRMPNQIHLKIFEYLSKFENVKAQQNVVSYSFRHSYIKRKNDVHKMSKSKPICVLSNLLKSIDQLISHG